MANSISDHLKQKKPPDKELGKLLMEAVFQENENMEEDPNAVFMGNPTNVDVRKQRSLGNSMESLDIPHGYTKNPSCGSKNLNLCADGDNLPKGNENHVSGISQSSVPHGFEVPHKKKRSFRGAFMADANRRVDSNVKISNNVIREQNRYSILGDLR